PIAYLPCFPNPVRLDCRQQKRSNDGRVHLAYFGRLAPNKGLDMLLQAMAEASVSERVSLDIWGNGSEETTLREIASRLGVDEYVQFRGAYPETESHLILAYDGLV